MRHLTNTVLRSLLIVILFGSWSLAAEQLDESPVRALVITGGHAYEEAPFEEMFQAMEWVTVEQASYPAAAELLEPELAERYDVIVFYDMWSGGLTPEQQDAFVALLEKGIGVVALHHTLAAHQQWPEYARIIGGKFHAKSRTVDGETIPKSGYDHGQDIEVGVADAKHPITRGMDDFTIHDETYCRYDTSPQARVLLKTDHPKSDPELAWTHAYANSRVVYLQLGHDHFAYEHESFRKFLARSIRFVAGRPADPDMPATPLFNGEDLTGWTAEGNASWEVENGMLIGKQGPGNAPGDLFTTDEFDNFEVKVTYRVQWPANSGVWYRYQSGGKSYQADILKYENPFALSGTLYRPGVPGTPFLATNTDPSIIDENGWNTLVIRTYLNRHEIFLNGHKTADVRDSLSKKGKLGIQVHQGDQFAPMQIMIKEFVIRPL